MGRLVGIFRVEADLREALDRLAELRARWANIKVVGGRVYNPGWNLVFELRALLIVSEAIARSASNIVRSMVSILSCASRILDSRSFSSGVLKRSALTSVCLRS